MKFLQVREKSDNFMIGHGNFEILAKPEKVRESEI